MSTPQKNRPIRQFSIRTETPTLELRRKTLKKQFSQDVPDRKPPETRNIQSAKTRPKITDDRPAIKLAWTEDIKVLQEVCAKKEESMVVKKCKEVKRPLTGKIKPNLLANKECMRHEFADHLRQVWKEREGVKQNLNIFLTHVTHEDCHDAPEKENANTEAVSQQREKPKIILPLKPTVFGDETDLKNAFQKQIRKTRRNSGTLTPRMPLKNAETTVFPSPKENQTMSVVLRPHTAAAKRESFQKRTNSAFNGSGLTKKPLLIRTSSLPSKPENAKPKFVATKRRVKSAKRCNKEEVSEQKVVATFPSCDIVTMVSLMSNSESETDDESDDDEDGGNKSGVLKKDVQSKETDLGLRKIVKTVSFQQSTIHAVRSFSASFPGRRSPFSLQDQQQKMQEKRTTTDAAVQDEDESTAKRRASSRRQGSFEDLTALSDAQKTEGNGAKPQLDTQKEKQCWELYKKMCEKGVTVSFDTILRGMLTPTEYRLHRKQSLVEQDNC